jgi:hypothetical protein
LDALIERRRALGIDLYDGVWKGSYTYRQPPTSLTAISTISWLLRCDRTQPQPASSEPGLSISAARRITELPDRGFHRVLPSQVSVPTAAIVVEIVAPDDETYDEFDFYFAHGVDEMIIADPSARTITFWSRAPTACSSSRQRVGCSPSVSQTLEPDHLAVALPATPTTARPESPWLR